MSKVTVENKKELEAAVKSKADVIVVTGDYAEKLKKHESLFKQSPKKRKIIITAIGGSCAALIATAVATAASAPATGGVSALIGGSAMAVEVGAATIATGLSVAEITAIVILGVLVGSTVLSELLRTYDLVESDVKIGNGSIEFHKKYNPHTSEEEK